MHYFPIPVTMQPFTFQPYHSDTQSPTDDALQAQISKLITPLLEHHSNLLQATFARLVAWEKAAVSAASARSRYQFTLAGAHRAQRSRRERAVRQLQAGRRRHKATSLSQLTPQIPGNDLEAANELSDSSSKLLTSLGRKPLRYSCLLYFFSFQPQ